MKKRKIIMARLVKRSEMDRSFDIEFWQRVGVQGRFEAAWQMVKEAHSIRGEDLDESRLQRSVQNINEEKVRYLVVGAYAVTFHAEPRYTKILTFGSIPTPKIQKEFGKHWLNSKHL